MLSTEPIMSFYSAELMNGSIAPSHVASAARALSDEVSTLAWAIIDGVASDADRERLADLLASERSLRKRYVRAVQMNTDLRDFMMESPQLGAA